MTRLVRGVVLTLARAALCRGGASPAAPASSASCGATSCPTPCAPLLVQGTYIAASAMITEAILSFLGAGTPPNIPSWGNIMAEGRSLFQVAYYIVLFPGLVPVGRRCWRSTCWATGCATRSTRASRGGCERMAEADADVATRAPKAAGRREPRSRSSRSPICGPISSPATASCAPSTASRFTSMPGETLAIVGEMRLRQERHRALDPAADPVAARPHRLAARSASTGATCSRSARRRCARSAATRSR